MFVPEITTVKEALDSLKEKGLLLNWELPYENLLTRLSAAIFFVTPSDEKAAPQIWKKLSSFEGFAFQPNEEKKLSALGYKITFVKDEPTLFLPKANMPEKSSGKTVKKKALTQKASAKSEKSKKAASGKAQKPEAIRKKKPATRSKK
jgi:hypothetical protein